MRLKRAGHLNGRAEDTTNASLVVAMGEHSLARHWSPPSIETDLMVRRADTNVDASKSCPSGAHGRINDEKTG